ncbi:MAG: TonB-dependent receptor plug domain-containing protein, partial [Candidatus Cryptobacteroides sp.]
MKSIIRTIILCSLALAVSLVSPAQTKKQVSGVVTDANGEPLPGVSVVISGTFNGTTTGNNGEYIIQASGDDILIYSCIGFKELKIKVGGNSKINVRLEEDNLVLEETVVTALGIKRSEKALGYAVTKVDNETLTNTTTSNWLNGLSGKVAGLNFDSASAGPSGSIRVTLRGESSLDPSKSEALFVVDGVPINSNMISNQSSSKSAYDATSVDMPIDYGNGASDLNPEDIESVTVLKGASATALYGSRAVNGAIVITTKSGKIDKGIGVSLSSSFTWEDAGYWPDFQNEYGAGNRNSLTQETYYSFYKVASEGISASNNHYAFGPRFEGQKFYQYGNVNEDGSYYKTDWVARDWYKGFFRTGFNTVNTITIQGNNGKGSSGRVSYSDTRNSWITPNSGYNRQVVSASFTSQVSKWINLGVRATYNRKQSDNLPMSGYSRATIPGSLVWLSPNVDINWLKDY